MKRYKVISFLLILLNACIDPLDIRVPVYVSQLVVDGGIYAGPGPHTVRLFLSSNLQNKEAFQTPQPVDLALVRVRIDDDAEVFFTQTAPGTFELAEGIVTAEPGRQYQLIIRTANQEEYRSVPQQLEPAGTLDNVYFEFAPRYFYDPQTQLYQDAFRVYVDARADAQSNGLLRWRYTGTYEIITQPELQTTVIGSPPARVPDPLPCSGYEVISDGSGNPESALPTPYGTIYRTGDCTCCSCWVTEHDGRVRLGNNQFVTDKTFNKVLIAVIPADRWRFFNKYSIEVEQLSISEDVYAFWKLVQAQQEGAGSLFQPNAVIIEGNIQNVTTPSRKALGIFTVSSVVKDRIFIERSDLPYTINDPDLFRNDCRLKFKSSSNVRPHFW